MVFQLLKSMRLININLFFEIAATEELTICQIWGIWWTVYTAIVRNYSFPKELHEKLDYVLCHKSCYSILLHGNRLMHLKSRWGNRNLSNRPRIDSLGSSSIIAFICLNTPSFLTEHDMPLRGRSLPQPLPSKPGDSLTL